MYRRTYYHIKGEGYVWADLLSRWSTVMNIVRRLVRITELTSSSSAEFEWPKRSVLANNQHEYDDSRPIDMTEKAFELTGWFPLGT